jgi:hypothetical protein
MDESQLHNNSIKQNMAYVKPCELTAQIDKTNILQTEL